MAHTCVIIGQGVIIWVVYGNTARKMPIYDCIQYLHVCELFLFPPPVQKIVWNPSSWSILIIRPEYDHDVTCMSMYVL